MATIGEQAIIASPGLAIIFETEQGAATYQISAQQLLELIAANMALKGVAAARPAANVAGRLYYATDTQVFSRDNGSNWDAITLDWSNISGTPTTLAGYGITDSIGGAVDSVNGQTGVVVLDAGDVGADPSGTAAAAIAAHLAAGDPHAQYQTQTEGDARYYQLTTDLATQNELDAEANTRAAADTANANNLTTHANLTTTAHGGIVASTDPRLTDARVPTAHASTHASAGSDPLTLAQSQITDLVADLLLKAPLASPALTGTPTAPTQANADDSTKLATTAFVHALITALINASPSTLDTLKELADAIGDDPNFAATVSTSIATKLAKASNLSDLTDASAARTNLGMGSLAVLSSITASLISDASANGRSLVTASDYAAMRTLLGLVIGTNVQAQDAELAALAGLTSAADKGIQFTGSGTAATFDLTTAGKALLDDANAAAQRTTLGLGTAAVADTGTGASNVPTTTQADARYQPLDSDLTTIAGLTPTTDNFLAAASSAWASRTPAQARVQIGLDKRTTVNNADYTILATDRYIAQIGTLSAARTLTLPAANSVNAGQQIIIKDESGTITATNTLTITRAGSDTIDGATSIALNIPRCWMRLVSDGTSKWSILGGSPFMIEYTSTLTDALPAGYTYVQWDIWGSGGGGGSGRRGATTTLRGGGGGGGGGAYTRTPAFLISDLGGPGTSVVNTIGAGGTAGAAQTGNDLDGSAGGNGGLTSVTVGSTKLLCFAGGGAAGGAGTTSGGVAGAAGSAMFAGATGGTGGVGGAGTGGNGSNNGGSGGGGGGGLDASDTIRAGGIGQRGAGALGEGGSSTVGTAGTAGGGNGSNLTTVTGTLTPLPVSSGGGGGSHNAGAGGTGGAGGRGCGGGGGGASQNGANSGAGNTGGGGYIRRYVW